MSDSKHQSACLAASCAYVPSKPENSFNSNKQRMISAEMKGQISLATAMILSGTIGYFVLLTGQNAFNVVFFRCLIGGLLLSLTALLVTAYKRNRLARNTHAAQSKKSSVSIRPKELLTILLAGFFLSITWLTLFSAYQYLTVGLATILFHLQPFIILLAGIIVFKETFFKHQIFLLLTAFAGLVLITQNVTGQGDNYLLGCLLAVLSAICYSLTTILTKSVKNVPARMMVTLQLLVGTIVFSFLADFNALPDTGLQWFSLILVGVVHTALMYSLMYSAYQKLETSQIAILGFVYPLTAVLVDYILLDKVLSVWQILGGLMIILSGLLFNVYKNIKTPVSPVKE